MQLTEIKMSISFISPFIIIKLKKINVVIKIIIILSQTNPASDNPSLKEYPANN
ncbi:hypothetical protein ABIE50_005497 [Chitinophaga sp. OAE865]